jgi:hypothetical protein
MPATVPFTDASTLLTTLSGAVRNMYHPDSYQEMFHRFGRTTNRVFKASKRRFEGNTMEVQVIDKNLHGTRITNDPNADFPRARAHSANNYTVTFNEAGGTTNDLRRLALSLQVTHFDIKRVLNKQVEAGQFIKDLLKQSMSDVAEKLALHRHLPTSGLVAKINGTPKQNNNRDFADASATPTTNTGARFPIDNGSLAAFSPGLRLHAYTGSTLDQELEVTDVNPRDGSIGVYGINGSGAADIAVNVSGLADNDDLYITTEKDQNIISFGAWFTEPSSGDSFFGKNRTTATNRWMLPHKSGPTSEQLLAMSHLDNTFVEMNFVQEDDMIAWVSLMEPVLMQRFMNVIGGDKIIQFPTGEQKGKLMAVYGFEGAIYRHWAAGRIGLNADPLAKPKTVRFLKLGDWETVFGYTEGGDTGFEWLPGGDSGPGGIFYRMESSTPGGGKTTTYKADGMCVLADICLKPREQIEIENVKGA